MKSKLLPTAALSAIAFAGFTHTTFADIEEVVVTARKVQESINEVPLSISAFDADDFNKRSIEDLSDVAKFTPGFSFESFSGGITPAPIIRGLAQTALQSRIQNVSVFIDGVYIQQQGNVDFGLLGIERIEVVKGPQSALYGRNSFAGAINYVTAKPTEEFEGYISGTLGSDEREDLKLTLSGPIIKDKLFGRITTGISEFDGTWENNFSTTNATTGDPIGDDAVSFLNGEGTDKNLGGYDNESLAVSLSFLPMDNLQLDLGYYDIELRREDGATGTLERTSDTTAIGQLNCSPVFIDPPGPAPGSFQNSLYCGEIDFDSDEIVRDPRNIGNYADSEIITFAATYDINENLTVKYLYGSTDLDAYSFGVGSGASVVVTTGTVSVAAQPVTYLESDSHELRFDYSTDGVRILAGLYQSEVEDVNIFNAYNVNKLATGEGIVPGFGPFAVDGIFEIGDDDFKDEITAVFGSVQYDLASDLTLGLEVRYTEEDKDYVDNLDPANSRSDVFSYTTPRITLDWQLNDEVLFYTSLAEGVKSGGFNSATADPGFESYDEETNLTFELGSKLTLLNGDLQFNSAFFWIDWEDLQLSFQDVVPVDPSASSLEPSYIGNAKGAESIGIEFDGVWALSDKLLFNFAASYAKAEFDDGVVFGSIGADCDPAICDLVTVQVTPTLTAVSADVGGNDLPRTPETQVSLGLEYSDKLLNTNLDYTVRGDISYQSEMQATPLNIATIESRTLANLNFIVSETDDKWNVNLWVKNLTDEEYIANSFVTGSPRRYITSFGDKRTFGITGKYNF